VVTNGESLDTTRTANIAEFARVEEGWKVIGMFVGATSEAGYRELVAISTDARNVEQLRVDTFDQLAFKATELALASVVAVVPFYGQSAFFPEENHNCTKFLPFPFPSLFHSFHFPVVQPGGLGKRC